MKVLTGYVRDKMRAGDVAEGEGLPDIRDPRRERAEEVMRVIGDRSSRGIEEERGSGYRVDLSEVDARAMQLADCNFSNIEARGTLFSQANLERSVFRFAQLRGSKFNGARLQSANLSQTDLEFACMKGANLEFGSLAGSRMRWADPPRTLYMCDLSDALMFEVRGLEQKTLDSADGLIRTPPSIVACLDAETGDELKWKGGDPGPLPKMAAAFRGQRRRRFPSARWRKCCQGPRRWKRSSRPKRLMRGYVSMSNGSGDAAVVGNMWCTDGRGAADPRVTRRCTKGIAWKRPGCDERLVVEHRGR